MFRFASFSDLTGGIAARYVLPLRIFVLNANSYRMS